MQGLSGKSQTQFAHQLPGQPQVYSEKKMINWIIRFLKGAIIGIGFILPGVSGGALAAIFGLYEKIIGFIAHITHDFIKNFMFFIPVGLGALFGMFLLSHPLGFFIEHYEAPVLWGFVGCIAGTLPKLWKDAGKSGRTKKHILIMIISCACAFSFLLLAETYFGSTLPRNTGTWCIAGVLIALGILIPGMSPSNFLVYLGLYKPMVEAFKTFDISVLLPILAGGAACLFLFSKIVDYLFSKIYTGIFHGILGIVLASTVMIIPGTPWSEVPLNYASPAAAVCIAPFVFGCILGWWMCRLEDTYKTVNNPSPSTKDMTP
jgi:putative membrane protein